MYALFYIVILIYAAASLAYILYFFMQKGILHQTGYGLMISGFLLHSILIGYEVAISGFLPAQNLHQILCLSAWTIAGVFLAFQYQFRLKILGIFAAPLVTAIMAVSAAIPEKTVQIDAMFKNFWLIFHIVIILIGEAAFAMACGIGILYMVQENAIKAKKHGFFYKRLPSLDILDSTGYACIITGFTLLTLGLISGFIYAKAIWGRFWSWDPKEVWSAITWLFYAALLHERLTVGWRGRRAAIMSIIGFGVVIFTFFGVNFLLKGHHGGFTRW
jgi:cytochrome c-type biogenesis protein CcsB